MREDDGLIGDELIGDELIGLRNPGMARRGFMMTSLISGLTLATTTVQAQAIHTDSEGLVAGDVSVPVADGMLPGYMARPEGAGPFPIVLVNEEIFGVHEYIKDICRRLAKRGYAAIAVEIYARLADLSKMTDYAEIQSKAISKKPDNELMHDLDSAVAYAAAHGGDRSRIGVIGFCRGGRNTWLYDAWRPDLKAAVAFYGPVGGATSDIQPKTVTDIAGQIHAPLLGLYGGKDPSIPVPAIEAAVAKARAAGKIVELVIYPDSPHAFAADYRPSYHEADAKDAFARMEAWLKKYLG